jgi:hypothetical protein
MTMLLIEDKLGISAGYMDSWVSMLAAAGFLGISVPRASMYRDARMSKEALLTRKGNRKAPGHNPDLLDLVREWVRYTVKRTEARMILCMDPAALGLVEPSWDISTTDNLRGGLYVFDGLPFLVTMPISAIHSKKNPKDIRALNDGAESKGEWEEMEHENEDLFFIEPYTIPFGRWVLAADLRKAYRIYMTHCQGN